MRQKLQTALLIISLTVLLSACSSQGSSSPSPALNDPAPETVSVQDEPSSQPSSGNRDNTSECLVPKADGTSTLGNDTVTIDISNASDGYICVTYSGDASRTRAIITIPSQVAYTYDLTTDVCEVFPLTGGVGDYNIGIYELISGNNYSILYNDDFSIDYIDEYSPYLYPNQYVNFDKNSLAVAKASELVETANDDAEAISMVYNYVIGNIEYDYEEADNIESTYVPNVDEVLTTKKGICFDYASLMAAMLRSQRIPTRLEIGYAGDVYHAWISTYISDVGWVNGMIQFDGTNWEIMDPTFAANMSEDKLKSFIGEGNNYTTKYMY